MAQKEEKNQNVVSNSKKEKKSVKKAYTKPEIVEIEQKYHTAEVGDTPYILSKKYDTSIEEIKKLNTNTDWLNLREGTKVRVK